MRHIRQKYPALPHVVLLLAAVVFAAAMSMLIIGNQAQAQTPDVPAKPTGLSATSVAHNSVTLAWDDPSDSSITGYQVLRRNTETQAPGNFSTISSNTGSAATSYVDGSVTPETRYAYRVKAINSAGTSPQSGYVNVTTPSEPVDNQGDVPARPTGLLAAVTRDNVLLLWDDPDDDSITGYKILRRDIETQAPGTFSTINANTASADATYSDTGVEPETRYAYRVVAINEHGESPRSGYVNAETLEEPPSETDPQSSEANDNNGNDNSGENELENSPLTSADVDGDQLTLIFDGQLRKGNDYRPANSAFTVKESVDGTDRTVAVTGVGFTDRRFTNRIVLNLTEPVGPGNMVMVSYTRPASNYLRYGNEQSWRYNDPVDSFDNIWVTNNTPPPPPPPPLPMPTLRAVTGLSYAWNRGRVQEYEIYVQFDRPVKAANTESDGSDGLRYIAMCSQLLGTTGVTKSLTITGATIKGCTAEVQSGQSKSPTGLPWLTTWKVTVEPELHENGGDVDVTVELAAGAAQYPATPHVSAIAIPYPADWTVQTSPAADMLEFTIRNQPASDHRPPSVQFDYPNPIITGEFNVDIWFADVYFEPRDLNENNPNRPGTIHRDRETVTGFTASDIRVSGGRVTSLTALDNAPAGHRYRATIKPSDASTGSLLNVGSESSPLPVQNGPIRDITLSIPANAVQDGARHGNLAWSSVAFPTYPKPIIESVTVATIANSSAKTVKFVWSKPVTGFIQSDVRVGRVSVNTAPYYHTASGVASVTAWTASDDGTTYTATVTPTQGGTVTVSVGHSAATSTDGYRSVGIHPLYLRLQAPASN